MGKWKKTLPGSVPGWRKKKANAILTKWSNGRAEGFHCKAKRLKREGYGFRNWNNFRLKGRFKNSAIARGPPRLVAPRRFAHVPTYTPLGRRGDSTGPPRVALTKFLRAAKLFKGTGEENGPSAYVAVTKT
jgi:hypothetical protein